MTTYLQWYFASAPQVAGLKKVEHANPEDLDEEFGGEEEEEDVIRGGQKDIRPQQVPEKSEQTLSLPSADIEAGRYNMKFGQSFMFVFWRPI